VSAQLKSFEGPDVQLLLDRIRTELGPGAKIDGAEKIRVGGVLGFFAKEHYRVVVEVPEMVETSGPAPAPLVSDPTNSRLSRRSRRKTEAAEQSRAQAMPVGESIDWSEPAPAAAMAPAETTDVFSAMAEATDDVNDVGALAPSPVAATPVPVGTEAPAVDGDISPGLVAEPVPESFDAVLTRVANTLEAPGRGNGPGHHAGGGHGAGGPAPAPAGEPEFTGDDVGDTPADIGDTPAGIASGAALFLAGTTPATNGAPAAHDGMAEALRRAGLDEAMVRPLSEGLSHGAGLGALLLEAFGGLVPAPAVPRLAGSLLVVVGPCTGARRLAAAVAAEIDIDPVAVPYASRDAGAFAVVTGTLLVRSVEDATERAPGWRRSQPAVVVVDAPVTTGERTWAGHVIAALRPTAVWGVVDATAKTEDIVVWARALGGLDALALDNLDATVSPAAALATGIPVARLNGQPATAARWAATIVDRVDPCT